MGNKMEKGSLKTPSNKIRLLISDIDGTLITKDKVLTPETCEAAKSLNKAGIQLCLVSSRPPQGIEFFFSQLENNAPFAALNGGEILDHQGHILSSLTMNQDVVHQVIKLLQKNNVHVWLFGGTDWLVFNVENAFVEHEVKTIHAPPQIISHFDQYHGQITKIGGISKDTDLLDRIAQELENKFSGEIKAARSSDHYLDITHPKANKGHAAIELGKQLGIDIKETACIGDMYNDIAMLKLAGLAIAMGQSDEEVQSHAHFVTESNENNGWAEAVKKYILPRA